MIYYVYSRIAFAASTAADDDATELGLRSCGKSSAMLFELNSPGIEIKTEILRTRGINVLTRFSLCNYDAATLQDIFEFFEFMVTVGVT